ncbi:MAG TPA: ribonuclease J, partial [Candidatus Caenarcaniphilales bacterium]
STNAEVPGQTPSERSVFPNLDRAFGQATGRLLVTTFASSVHRVNMILELAKKHKRVVSVVGRSMLNVIAHARNLGYIKCEDSLFQPLHMIQQLPDDQVLILTTGSQGELMAALTRIARREHRQIKIRQGDTVVLSANPIPGNTLAVVKTIDQLMMQGAQVIYGREQGIHVSGHACQEDQKLMIALTRPQFFLPVHGEHRMLVKHAQTAQSMGIAADNMLILNNGDIVELTPSSLRVAGQVPAGVELVDAARSGVVHEHVLQERQQLAEVGIVTVAATIDQSGNLVAEPEVNLRGVVTAMDRYMLQTQILEVLEQVLDNRWHLFARNLDGTEAVAEVDWAGLQSQIELELQRFLRRELHSNPLLVFLMQSLDEQPPTQQPQSRSTAQVAS